MTARPVAHVDPGQPCVFHATPVLFMCQDAEMAHECALLLRHGGLPGPNAPPAVASYQIAKFSTNNFTYY